MVAQSEARSSSFQLRAPAPQPAQVGRGAVRVGYSAKSPMLTVKGPGIKFKLYQLLPFPPRLPRHQSFGRVAQLPGLNGLLHKNGCLINPCLSQDQTGWRWKMLCARHSSEVGTPVVQDVVGDSFIPLLRAASPAQPVSVTHFSGFPWTSTAATPGKR